MWPNQDETVELLGSARQGNPDAVDRLLARHRDSLRRMVQCRLNQAVGRRVDASDIVQDALLTASRRLGEYLKSPHLPFHAWLRQLARDRLADVYRRELASKRNIAREQCVGSGERSSVNPMAQVSDHRLTPLAVILKNEAAECFHRAVDRLDSDAKEVVLMRHAEQLTNSQVAELLGISEPAAGMRYLRALRQLKSWLADTSSLRVV